MPGKQLAAKERPGWQRVSIPKENMTPVHESCEVFTLKRPHRSSYYLPGKVEGAPVNFLLDTWCNTNWISEKVIGCLPTRIKNLMEDTKF